jgi:hypothetical protein
MNTLDAATLVLALKCLYPNGITVPPGRKAAKLELYVDDFDRPVLCGYIGRRSATVKLVLPQYPRESTVLDALVDAVHCVVEALSVPVFRIGTRDCRRLRRGLDRSSSDRSRPATRPSLYRGGSVGSCARYLAGRGLVGSPPARAEDSAKRWWQSDS